MGLGLWGLGGIEHPMIRIYGFELLRILRLPRYQQGIYRITQIYIGVPEKMLETSVVSGFGGIGISSRGLQI